MPQDIYEAGQARNLAALEAGSGAQAEVDSAWAAARAAGDQPKPKEIPTVESQANKLKEHVMKSHLDSFDQQAAALARGVPKTTTDELQVPVKGVASGVAVGALKAAENMWNLVNMVDDVTSKSFGKTLPGQEPGVIGPANFASKIPLGDDIGSQAGAAIGEYVAPFMLGGAVTGSVFKAAGPATKFMAGVATDGIMSQALDPHQQRFSDVIVKKYPWMRALGADLFAAGPNDSEFVGRMKNAGEAMTLGGLGGLLAHAVGASKWMRNLMGADKATQEVVHVTEDMKLPAPDSAEARANAELSAESAAYVRKLGGELPGAEVKMKPTEGAAPPNGPVDFGHDSGWQNNPELLKAQEAGASAVAGATDPFTRKRVMDASRTLSSGYAEADAKAQAVIHGKADQFPNLTAEELHKIPEVAQALDEVRTSIMGHLSDYHAALADIKATTSAGGSMPTQQMVDYLTREQNPRLNPETFLGDNHPITMDAVTEVIQGLSDKIKAGRTGTVAWDETHQLGLDYMNARPEEFADLLRAHQPGTAYTAEEFSAIQTFSQALMQDYIETSAKVAGLKNKSFMELTEADNKLMSKMQAQQDSLSAVLPVYAGAQEHTGRMLNFMRMELPGLGKGRAGVRAVMEHLRLAGGGDEVAHRSLQVQQAIENLGKSAAPTLMMTLGKTAGDMEKALTEIALSGMVSAPRTTMRAATGGFIYNMRQELQSANLAAFGRVMGLDSTQWGAARAAFGARMAGMRLSGIEAFQEGWRTLKTGRSSVSAFDYSAPALASSAGREEANSSGGFLAKQWMFSMANSASEKVLRGTGIVRDYGTRGIRAVDSMNGAFARRQAYIEASAREAFAEGFSPEATAANIEARTLFPTKQTMQAADDAARESAYNQDYQKLMLDSRMGKIAETAADHVASWPLGKAMIPYMRTGANEMIQTLESTPVLGMLAPRNYAAFRAGGADRAQAIAKMAVGLEVVGSFAAATHFGNIETSGGEPENKELLRAIKQRDPGWLPNAIKLNGTWYSHEPLGVFSKLMSAYADFREMATTAEEGENVRWGHALGLMAVEHMVPRQIMEDLPALMHEMHGLAQQGKEADVASFFTKFSPRFVPFSGALREARQLVDPVQREIQDREDPWKTFTNAIKNTIPGMSSSMPPARNMFGEVVLNPHYLGSDAFSPFQYSDSTGDATSAELKRLGLWNTKFVQPPPGQPVVPITMPERTIGFNLPPGMGGGRVPMNLSPVEYDMFVRFSAGLGVPTKTFSDKDAAAAGNFSAGEYQQFLSEHTRSGSLRPLKEALTDLYKNRERYLGQSGQLGAPPEVQDNYMRLYTKDIIEAYRKMGRAAMFASLKNQAKIKKGLIERAQALGGRVPLTPQQ